MCTTSRERNLKNLSHKKFETQINLIYAHLISYTNTNTLEIGQCRAITKKDIKLVTIRYQGNVRKLQAKLKIRIGRLQ